MNWRMRGVMELGARTVGAACPTACAGCEDSLGNITAAVLSLLASCIIYVCLIVGGVQAGGDRADLEERLVQPRLMCCLAASLRSPCCLALRSMPCKLNTWLGSLRWRNPGGVAARPRTP